MSLFLRIRCSVEDLGVEDRARVVLEMEIDLVSGDGGVGDGGVGGCRWG